MEVCGQLHSLLFLIPGKSPRNPLHQLRGELFCTELSHTPQSSHYFDYVDIPNFILSPVNRLNIVYVYIYMIFRNLLSLVGNLRIQKVTLKCACTIIQIQIDTFSLSVVLPAFQVQVLICTGDSGSNPERALYREFHDFRA